jgi:hypothetical protein
LSGDRLVGINIRTVPHLLGREFDRKKLALPVRLPESKGSNEHLSAWQPGTRINHQIAYGPGCVVEEKSVHRADITIHGTDGIAMQFF